MTDQTFSDHSQRFHARVRTFEDKHSYQCRKYMEIGKFLDFLTHRRLPLSRVDTFSDKAEARVSIELKRKHLLDRVDWIKQRTVIATGDSDLDESVARSYEEIKGYIKVARNDEELNSSLGMVSGILVPTGFKAALLRPWFPDSANDYLQEWYCFSCCGPNSSSDPRLSDESYLMWKTYVPSGKGVSFTFNSLMLLRALEDPIYYEQGAPEPDLYFDKVDYSGRDPGSIEDAVFSKRAYYKDENEVRYAKRLRNGGGHRVEYCNLSLSLPTLIEEVTFSPFMSQWEIDTYIEVIRTIWHKHFDEVASVPPFFTSDVEMP